jgi:hypothetical protein
LLLLVGEHLLLLLLLLCSRLEELQEQVGGNGWRWSALDLSYLCFCLRETLFLNFYFLWIF